MEEILNDIQSIKIAIAVAVITGGLVVILILIFLRELHDNIDNLWFAFDVLDKGENARITKLEERTDKAYEYLRGLVIIPEEDSETAPVKNSEISK